MIKSKRFIFSSAAVTIFVIVLSFAAIIALWTYTDVSGPSADASTGDPLVELFSRAEHTANMRLMVFILSTVIVVSIVVFIDQMQKRWAGKLQAARLQAEQINRQLEVSVTHANLMTQRAMEAGQSKSEFLANISHAIRTPMNAIIGFSEMLAEEHLTEQQKKQVGIIRDSSRLLLKLVNDILDFSKIEAGKLDIEIADCNVENVLKAVDSLMRPAAAEKKLQFEIIRNEPLPKLIRTDSARLKQCLVNLISNAIRFTDRGRICVRVFWDNNNDKPFIRFDIEDTGIGISSEQLYCIFEPFSQIDSGIIHRFGGTGLGLAITRSLAELLGGSVAASSMIGRGSIFTLVIPTGMPSDRTVGSDGSVEAVGDGQRPSAAVDNVQLVGRALIAEDSTTNQTLIELLLKKLGIETVAVENGRQAVQKAMAEKFDIILMDIQMPVMNGYEATKHLRQAGIKTPIIALTACVMKGDNEKCFAAGCNDYIPKPIDRKMLVDTLIRYLPAGEAGRSRVAVKHQQASDSLSGTGLSAEALANTEVGINWQLLMERVGSEELVDEIIPIFIKDNSERMRVLSQAVEKNDIGEIKFYAHSLKGASATIGAVGISELSRQLEAAARESDSSGCKPLFEELKVRFARLVEFLSKSNWKQIAQQASSRQHTERS